MDFCFTGGLLMILGGVSLFFACIAFLGFVLMTLILLLSFYLKNTSNEMLANESDMFTKLVVFTVLGVSCFVLSEYCLDLDQCRDAQVEAPQ